MHKGRRYSRSRDRDMGHVRKVLQPEPQECDSRSPTLPTEAAQSLPQLQTSTHSERMAVFRSIENGRFIMASCILTGNNK